MFNTQRKVYTIYKPHKVTDSYKQEIVTYEEAGTAQVFISLNTHATLDSNSMYVTQCEYTGVTSSPLVEVGDRIGDTYEVAYITEGRRERYLFLRNYGRGSNTRHTT